MAFSYSGPISRAFENTVYSIGTTSLHLLLWMNFAFRIWYFWVDCLGKGIVFGGEVEFGAVEGGGGGIMVRDGRGGGGGCKFFLAKGFGV